MSIYKKEFVIKLYFIRLHLTLSQHSLHDSWCPYCYILATVIYKKIIIMNHGHSSGNKTSRDVLAFFFFSVKYETFDGKCVNASGSRCMLMLITCCCLLFNSTVQLACLKVVLCIAKSQSISHGWSIHITKVITLLSMWRRELGKWTEHPWILWNIHSSVF